MRDDKMIKYIVEKALGIKLYPWQIDYIFYDKPFPDMCPCLVFQGRTGEKLRKLAEAYSLQSNGYCMLRNRGTGFTTAYCIKIALFSRKILDTTKPWEFSDFGDGSLQYAKTYFKNRFLEIWTKLRDAGLPVVILYMGGKKL